MTHPPTRKSLGFTLLELLVVMVLIGLITAVAVPVAGAGIQTLRLQSGARHVAAALRLARGRAIRSQEIHLVSLDREQRRVTVSSGDLRFQRTFQLPQGVRLQEALLLDGTPPPGPPHTRTNRLLLFPQRPLPGPGNPPGQRPRPLAQSGPTSLQPLPPHPAGPLSRELTMLCPPGTRASRPHPYSVSRRVRHALRTCTRVPVPPPKRA